MVEDTTGIAGLQAGMSGIPLVGVQTVRGYDGQNDEIFSSNTPSLLASKLEELNLYSIRQNYGIKTCLYVKNNFSLDRFFASYDELYSNMLNDNG